MSKSLNLLIAVFCFVSLGYAQESLVVYPKPFRFEKVNDRLVSDAIIVYKGDKKNLTIELNGSSLSFQEESDSLKTKLPLIGDKMDMVFKQRGRVVKSQIFYPYIPSDWDYFKNGTIEIINTSHQDIAWMNTPDSCKDERIHKIIIPALKMAKENPGFSFGMEQTLNLREILDEYPTYKNDIEEAYHDGTFSWGATFNQPYEGLLSSEQLVRGLYLGKKWIRDQFDNKVDSRTAFNMDVPGRIAQFPQILNKAGVKYLVISRMKEGFFKWYSPDGSSVLTYSPGNYGWASMFYKYFNEDAPTAMNKLSEVLKNWNSYYASRNIPAHFAIVISNDAAGPIYYKQVIDDWNKIADQANVPIPRLKYSTAENFLLAVDKPGARFDSISGERPNLWLYIHGPAHYEAIKAKKEAGIHLPAAEMFSTINCLLKNNFSLYQRDKFDSAWYKSIYDDHGWGGKHGEITDSIFGAYNHQANAMANQLLKNSLESISSQVKTIKNNSVIVFNGLSWKRDGIVEINLPENMKDYTVIDNDGRPLFSQYRLKGDSTELLFMADSVPSIGYNSFHLTKKKKKLSNNHTIMTNYCENKYYKIDLGNGGVRHLYDKELGKSILNTTRFAGGDVMDLGYNGNGAGEFTEITTPNMANFDKLSNHTSDWKVIEDGDLYSTFQSENNLNGVQIIQRIIVYHLAKKITFEFDIPDWKGVKNRQLRFALGLNADNASITYDVPMGVSTVGMSELKMKPGGWAWGGTYNHHPSETHPREVQNFVSASSKEIGLTMSSGISVFDWIDPTVDAVTYPVIQAVMLSSHKSCHGEGNWYLQKGAHSFSFSISTHQPGWKNGYAFGIENNHKLYAIRKKEKQASGKLPNSLSFVNSSSPFVQVTAFKKAGDDNKVILRLVDMAGEKQPVTIKFFQKYKTMDKVSLIEEEYPGKNGWKNSNVLSSQIGNNSIETYNIDF